MNQSSPTAKFKMMIWPSNRNAKEEFQILKCVASLRHTVDGRNPKQPPRMYKPCKEWDFNYLPQLVSLPDFWLPSTVEPMNFKDLLDKGLPSSPSSAALLTSFSESGVVSPGKVWNTKSEAGKASLIRKQHGDFSMENYVKYGWWLKNPVFFTSIFHQIGSFPLSRD